MSQYMVLVINNDSTAELATHALSCRLFWFGIMVDFVLLFVRIWDNVYRLVMTISLITYKAAQEQFLFRTRIKKIIELFHFLLHEILIFHISIEWFLRFPFIKCFLKSTIEFHEDDWAISVFASNEDLPHNRDLLILITIVIRWFIDTLERVFNEVVHKHIIDFPELIYSSYFI